MDQDGALAGDAVHADVRLADLDSEGEQQVVDQRVQWSGDSGQGLSQRCADWPRQADLHPARLHAEAEIAEQRRHGSLQEVARGDRFRGQAQDVIVAECQVLGLDVRRRDMGGGVDLDAQDIHQLGGSVDRR